MRLKSLWPVAQPRLVRFSSFVGIIEEDRNGKPQPADALVARRHVRVNGTGNHRNNSTLGTRPNLRVSGCSNGNIEINYVNRRPNRPLQAFVGIPVDPHIVWRNQYILTVSV